MDRVGGIGVVLVSVLAGLAPAQIGLIRPLAMSGIQAPGLQDGILLESVGGSLINDRGDILVSAIARGAGIAQPESVLYRIGANSSDLELLVRNNQAIPSQPPGTVLGDFTTNGMTRNGSVLTFSFLEGPDVIRDNAGAISLINDLGDVRILARDGNQAPGLPSGILLNRGFFNNAQRGTVTGHALFQSPLVGPGVTSDNGLALFRIAPSGTVSLVAREGDQAPDLPSGVRISALGLTFSRLDFSDSGPAIFPALLDGPGVDFNNDLAVFRDTGAGIGLVARQGDQVTGSAPGVQYDHFGTLLINAADEVALEVDLRGGDVTGFTRNAIVSSAGGGGLRTIVRQREAVPGTPSGTEFQSPRPQ